jgi:phospholipid/cholesterol/gamma-HCH transport system permease protein
MSAAQTQEQPPGRIAQSLENFGLFIRFCALTFSWFIADLWRIRRWRLVWPQMFEVGTRSVPVVMVTGGFIGMVLAIELFEQFRTFGQETRLGGIIGLSVVKHLGPVLAAVMLAGRVGGAFAAEIGTMNVTEQIDALRVMGTEPVSYLVVPRLIACLVMIPITTVFGDVLGIMGGWLITVVTFGVTNNDFWTYSAQFVGAWDISMGLVKSLFFGVTIAMVATYKGFNCKPGAAGVGRAATDAFVTSFICIIVMNFFLAKLAKDLGNMIWGYSQASGLG